MPADTTARWRPAWLALIQTHATLWNETATQMRQDSGLTMARYDVLMQLDIAGGRLGLSDLAAAILLSPSGLSKLVDRMAAAGLLRREPDPADARSTFATITPHGRRAVRKARLSHHDWLDRVFGGALDDRDVADLTRIMSQIHARTPNSARHTGSR